jgi:hypothetical protein
VTIEKHDRKIARDCRRVAAAIGLGLVLGAGPAQGQDTAGQEIAGQEIAGQEEAVQEVGRPGAILQGLDKTTARVSTIEVPLDQPARFGTLQIVARACHKKPPTETPESTAFLEIVDIRPDSPAIPVFTGWMFASSPSVSAMEHPVYDVWVIDCRTIAPPKVGAAGAAESLDLGEPQAE